MLKTKHTKRQEEARLALRQMKRLMTGFRGHLDEELSPLKVTTAQLTLLYYIQNDPHISGAELARCAQITPQTTQTLLQRAVKSGWVLRTKSKGNGKIVTASLTPAGEMLLEEADKMVRKIGEYLWKNVRTEELKQLNATLALCLGRLEA